MIDPSFKPHQCHEVGICCTIVESQGTCNMYVSAKRGFETHHQKFKIGISVVPQKALCPLNFFRKDVQILHMIKALVLGMS